MKKKRRSAYLLESLEARLLFSADLAPLPVDGGTTGAKFESDLEISLQPDSAGMQEANENSQKRQEVIFVDSGVDDYQRLIDDIESQLEKGRQFDIVNLDSDSDGIDQISAYLRQHEGIDAVHVVSHGSQDAVKLGNVWLTPDKLDAYGDAIEGWQHALSKDADLLFYGCNLAADDGGQDLVNSLTLLTGADVAASDDVTGNDKFGGDWVLEYKSGEIEASVPFSVDLQANWSGLLNTFTVTTTADGGAGSLRQAIIDANALGGSNEIILNAGTYKLTLGPAGDDNANNGDLDITSDLTITGAGADVTIIDGNSLDRVFHLRGSTANLTLTDLTITGGSINNKGGGIYVEHQMSQLRAERVIVTGNIADDGAGIFNDGIMTLTDVVISNNGDATTNEGGGIHNKETATLERVTISGNHADKGGGKGGGIHNDNTAWSLSLKNVTISGNSAEDIGGGLHTERPVTIVNSTITLNSASTGGGIHQKSDTVNIKNTIVAENSASLNPDVEGTFNSQRYNLIGDKGSAFGFTDGVNGDQVGTTGSPIDPMLDVLWDNGGFTPTRALLAGSPAIDPVGLTGAPPLDQRGANRDGLPDIGAFEFGAAIGNNPGTVTIDNTIPAQGDTLTASVIDPDGAAGAITYQWHRGGVAIAGATSSTYTTVQSDVGAAITVTATYTDDLGSGESPTSASTAAVTNVNDTPTATNLTTISAYNEGDASVAITDIVVNDVDAGETITATLTLNDTSTGSLSANDGATYTAGTGVWTITDTVANVNLALANLVFAPNVNNDVDTTISVSIDDGDEDASGPLTGTITLDVTPADITSDLIVHLEFSEGSGTTAFDSTAYGNNAYLTGTQDWVGGAIGGGFHFDYSDGEDFFEINNAASVENLQEGNFTLAAWFKADDVPPPSDAYGIIVKEGWHTGVWYNSNKQIVFEHTLSGPSYPRVVSTNTYDPGSYHHIAVTLDRPSGTMTLYVDGVFENSSSFTPGAASWEYNNETWKVGTARNVFPTSVDFPAKGSVDDVRIYSRAITAPESAELSNLGNSAPTASGTYTMASTDENTTSAAVQVNAILSDASITANDLDGDTLGIAVFATTGLGNWQYSTDGATGWTGFGAVDPNAALLLSETTWVRYVPDGANGESVGFDFRAWDQSTDLPSINGTPRFGDIIPGGGNTAYSIGTASVALTVSAANDAPTATNLTTTSSYNEGDATVAITDIVVSDVDTAETITAWLTLADTSTGSLSANDGATYDGGTGEWTITDTVATVNTALANLVFNPNVNNDVDTTISVVIDDGDEDASGPLTGTITLNVTPVDDPPMVVTNAPLNVPEESTRTITSAYLETTDPDNSPDQIIYTLTSLPSGGWVRLNGSPLTLGQTFTQDDINNNRVTYRDSDGGETTSFTLTVSDGNTTLPAFSFSINGQPINDAPVVTAPGSALNATEQIGLAIHGTGFSVSDLDEAGAGAIATLTVGEGTISVVVGNSGVSIDSGDGTGTVALSGSIAQLNALLTGISTGTITYLNNSDNPSSSTTLTITVNDQGNTGTDPGLTGDGSSEEGSNSVTINIAPVNDVPVATGNTVIASEDVPLVIGPGDFNFTDVEGDSLVSVTITGLNLNGGTLTHSAGAVTVTNGMTITAAQLADLTFISALNNSSDCSFAYTVNDAGSGVTSAMMNITVNAVNDVPVATGNTVIASEDVPLVIGPGDFNFTDVEGDSLASVTITGLNLNAGTLTHSAGAVTVTNGMTITVAELADLTFTSALNDSTNCSFTYRVNDAGTGVTSAVMNITVNAVNDVPVATGNTVITTEDVPLVIGPGDFNFTDVEGDSLVSVTITGLNLNGGTLTHSAGAVTVTNGMTITAAELVDLTFTSALNDSTNCSFTYRVNDAGTGVTSAVMNITVNAVNDVPVATGNTVIASEDVPLVIGPGDFNFSDVEGDSLASVTITGLNLNGGTLTHSAGAVNVTNGMTITAAELADLTFTSALNDSTDCSFTYTVNDAGSGVTSAVMNITVNAVNDAGTVTINNTTPAQGDTLTANVVDPDGVSGAITYQWFSDGAVIGGATGKTYTTTQGDVDAVMTVTAIYTDDQGTDESLTSAPTAPVTNVNDTPIAVNDNLNAIEDQSMTFTSVTDLLGNDSDIDGDTLTVSSFSQPGNGSLADNGDGTVTYTSANNFSGVDSFTYTISDNKGGTASGAAIILITPVGDTPQVTNVSTDADVQSGLINIDRNANDGAEVTYFKISGITNGTLYLADGVTRIDNGDFITVGQGQAGLRFTPAANSIADGSFNVESSENGVSVASQSGIATSIISILTTAPQPSEPVPSLPPSGPEEVVSEETEQEESEELEDVADETDVQAIADDMASVEAPQHTKAPGIKKASLVPGISVFKRADLKSNNDRTPDRSTLFSPQTLKKLIESENLGELKTALGKLNIATLPPDVYELVRGSLDAVQEEMGKEILIGKTVVGSAIATSVGLSAGYVVWMLKGGSLLASVLSSLPAWQLADPLAILVGTKEDEDEDDDTLETIIKDGSRRNEDKERKASELNKHKKEPTKR